MNSTRFFLQPPLSRSIGLTFSLFLFCLPSLLLAKKDANLDNLSGYRFEFLTFKADQSEKTYLEVFAQIPTDNLTYAKKEEGYRANYSISVNLYNQMGFFVDSKIYKNSVKFQSGDRDQPLTFRSHIVKIPFLVSPGQHKAVLYITDLENLESLVFSKMIDIPDYRTPDLHLSDIQISSSLKHTTEASSFVKNNWKFLPNVSNVFGERLKTLYIYAELYNLTFPTDESALRLKSVFSIKKRDGEAVKLIERDNLKFVGTNVLAAQIPIGELTAGQYQLTLNVTDLDSGESVGKTANFIVVEPVLISSSKTKPRTSP